MSTSKLGKACPLLCSVSLCLLLLPGVAGAQEPKVIPCGTIGFPADVTSDLQAAVGLSSTTYIQLTAGYCEIHDTIKITNRDGLRIEGDGRGATRLVWMGPTDRPMFSVQNSADNRFATFSACTYTDALESAFDIYNACHDGYPIMGGMHSCSWYNAGDPPGSHRNTFEDIYIGNCGLGSTLPSNGIRVRLHPEFSSRTSDDCDVDVRADCNNDQNFFHDVHIPAVTDTAIVFEGVQSTGNTLTDVYCGGMDEEGLDDPGPRGDHGSNRNDSGQSCVMTGIERSDESTAGSFSWFGGIANGLSDSVFVLGSTPEAVYVSGLHSRESRMLMRNTSSDAASTGGVTVESTFFDTSRVRDEGADDGTGGALPWEEDAAYGLVVDMSSAGPIVFRNDYFGPVDFVSDAADIALCWDPPQHVVGVYPETDIVGSFSFVGNAVVTSNDNPFKPRHETGSGQVEYMECVYPTIQESNLVREQALIGVGFYWKHMKQHTSILDSVESKHSVAITRGSHQLFKVQAARNPGGGVYTGTINSLVNGIPGQKVVLLGPETASVTLLNARGLGHWPNPSLRAAPQILRRQESQGLGVA